jgi:predicted nucleotidyltransferase component of viral defense system
LIEIVDRPALSQHLAFKGGSCAAMLGYLDRFSVDLDFDVLKNAGETALRQELHQVFEYLGLTVMEELKNVLMFRLRYPSEPGKRNNLKVSASSLIVKANQYRVQYLPEIDRMMTCQTVETMFANKLVALTDRYDLHGTIAGRDIYDIHHFFVHGYAYHAQVIQERTSLEPKEYLSRLSDFIRKHVTQTIINEDLNALLPYQHFQQIRKVLIPETLAFLERDLAEY